jgi:hypothetical protein
MCRVQKGQLESFTQPPRQAAGNPQQTHARAERHTPQAEERSRNSASSRTDSSSGAALVPGQPEVEPERGLILAKTGRALLAAPAGVTPRRLRNRSGERRRKEQRPSRKAGAGPPLVGSPAASVS